MIERLARLVVCVYVNTKTYRDLRPNQRIWFKVPNGLRLDKVGRITQEYKTRSARVHPLLMFSTHVVANVKPFGVVVDDSNFIR